MFEMYLHSKLSIIYYVKNQRRKGVSIMDIVQPIEMLTQLHHHT
ncbi:hypothetical protein [Bacillus mobilis]